MKHETEVKLKVEAPTSLRRRLKELGFVITHRRHFERNQLYDFSDSRLRKSHCLLRLRMEGSRSIVTFKGTPRPSKSYKIREEIETEVEDAWRLAKILAEIGLQPVFRYEKIRTAYAPAKKAFGGPELLLDETPIGHYVELEGPRKWIDDVARRLGYGPNDYISASYATLYLEHCCERGIRPGNMVFSREEFRLGSRPG